MSYDGRGLKFGTVAEQYDAYRPGPPLEAAELLGDLHGRDVLEVGAGTGLWTRFLEGLGATLTIVEPDDEMRAVLERQSPEVRSLVGSAESLPVPDESFDVVLCSSAWHWFEQPAATIEMARVLRDRGKLFVLWNGFSRDVEWLRRLTELRENPGDTNARPRGWSAGFPRRLRIRRRGECAGALDLAAHHRTDACGFWNLLGHHYEDRSAATCDGSRTSASPRRGGAGWSSASSHDSSWNYCDENDSTSLRCAFVMG